MWENGEAMMISTLNAKGSNCLVSFNQTLGCFSITPTSKGLVKSKPNRKQTVDSLVEWDYPIIQYKLIKFPCLIDGKVTKMEE